MRKDDQSEPGTAGTEISDRKTQADFSSTTAVRSFRVVIDRSSAELK